MSKELSSTTIGKDVFEVLDNFFQQIQLDWKKLLRCTIDGAPSILGRKYGLTTYVKTISSNTTVVLCFVHRFALCAKVLPEKMLLRLKRVIKLINFVKTCAVNTRLFKRLCENFGSKHTCLLYYTEVHRLSRSNATRRLFELRGELLQFFRKKNHDFQADLESKKFAPKLAYLSDIFEVLNNFNMSFQGPNGTLSEYISKLQAFVHKRLSVSPLDREREEKKSMQRSNSSSRLKTNLTMNFLKKLSAIFCN